VGRERTEGERLAAREFADAVRTEAERFFDAMLEEVRRNPELLRARPSGALTEEEADRLALAAVHRAREEASGRADDHPPSEREVEAWSKERDRDREARPPVWRLTHPR
jgi:hypothetical protein